MALHVDSTFKAMRETKKMAIIFNQLTYKFFNIFPEKSPLRRGMCE